MASLTAMSSTATEVRLRPLVTRFSDFDAQMVGELLPSIGLCVVKEVPEDKIEEVFPYGAMAMPQYEGVFGNMPDPALLRITAEDDPAIPTTAFKHKSTTKHMDGYQFTSPYRGVSIAGVNNMADIEVLAYPRVGDARLLMFVGLGWAATQLPQQLYRQLCLPDYLVQNDEYRANDPELRGATTAVIYDDGRGFRFHVGSKIRGMHRDAEFALSVLLELADADKEFFWLSPGDVYLTWQRWVCHNAVRSRPTPNQEATVLVRRLMRARPAENTNLVASAFNLSQPTRSNRLEGHR